MVQNGQTQLPEQLGKDRLFNAFEQIGQLVQTTLDLDEVLDILVRSVMEAGIFRSLMIALVDRVNEKVTVVRQSSRFIEAERILPIDEAHIDRSIIVSDLNGSNPSAEVVRVGEMVVIEGWDERFQHNNASWVRPETHRDKVSYFFPVMYDGDVIAVLATASRIVEREQTLAHINLMCPLLGQIGIAIRHAQMHHQVSQKAELLSYEAQDRIAQQEVLLKINRAVQTMRDPVDIEGVLRAVYDGLHTLDMYCPVVGLHQPYDLDRKRFDTLVLMPDKNKVKFIRFLNKAPIAYKIFQSGQTTYYSDVDTDAGYRTQEHFESTFKKTGVRIRSVVDTVNDKSLFVFMSAKKNAFSEQQVQFLKEISQLIVVGLARLEDLELVRRRADSQALLLEIGRATQSMTKTDDFESLIQMLYDRLKAHGINFVGVSLYRILDEETQTIASYHRRFDNSFAFNSGVNPGVVGDWKNGKTLYRPSPEKDPKGLPEGYLDQMYHQFDIRVESMLNVPYARGVLVLRSDQPEAFPEDDIRFIEQIADMLSIAVTRVEDLERLETQNRTLQENEVKMQAQLQELEGVYQHTPVGLFMVDRELRLLRFNDWIAEMNGLKQGDMGRSLADIIPDQMGERKKIFDRIFESGEPVHDLEVEGHAPTEPDVSRTWLANYYPLLGEDGKVERVLGAIVDITDKKQMEEERQRTGRLRALGEMAAGVSHNLNNILTGILGPAQLLQISLTDETALEDIETIITSGLRARDIVQELNRGLRNDRETLEPVNVGEVIVHVVQVAQPRWKDEAEARGVKIEVNIMCTDVPRIQGTKTGFHDMILNLILNAVDAMPDGGTITIGAYKVDERVRVVVRDTGTGMNEKTQKRVFDPFLRPKSMWVQGWGFRLYMGPLHGGMARLM